MTVIKIKNSNVAGRVPASGDLEIAELGINLQDKKLYSKDASGTVFEIGAAGDLPSGPTPPGSGNNVGDLFYNTKAGEEGLYYWDGSRWVLLSSEPADGEGYVKVSGSNMTGNLTLGTDKILLDATAGAAEFEGYGYFGRTLSSAAAADGVSAYEALYNTGKAGFKLQQVSSPTGTMVCSWNNAAGSSTIQFKHEDGSAEFAADVVVSGGYGNGGTTLASDGSVAIDGYVQCGGSTGTKTILNSGDAVFYGYSDNVITSQLWKTGELNLGGDITGGQPNAKIASDGSAHFKGDVTSDGSIGFNLEADNPDSYTTTTEEYEDTITGLGGKIEKTVTRTREIKTYTGPVLDVKQTLLAYEERFKQQDAVIAQMTAALRELGKEVSLMPTTGDEEPKPSRKRKS